VLLERVCQPEASDGSEPEAGDEPLASLIEREKLVEEADGPGQQADDCDEADCDEARKARVAVGPREEDECRCGCKEPHDARDHVLRARQDGVEKGVNVHVLLLPTNY